MENIQRYMMRKNSLKYPKSQKILPVYFIKMILNDVKL